MDLRVQGALENELRKAAVDQQVDGAVGIVTNVRTGEILGMASWPEYDPNDVSTQDANRMKNRAAAAIYEMGSVFKIFTFAIGLETGTAQMSSTYDARSPMMVGTRKITDFHAENRILTFEDVFIKSSNIGSAEIAKNVGLDPMKTYFERLGLFRRAEVELREVASPLLPKLKNNQWTMSSLASVAFGHEISVSPLSFVQSAGAVMNGGYLVPLTIKKASEPNAKESQHNAPRLFSANTTRQMLDLMRTNVVKGTGGRANAPGLRVGGKTGTADKVVNGRYSNTNEVSSFVAVFPTDGAIEDDRYMVFILMDNPRGSPASSGLRVGGAVAAPVAGHVINRIAPFVNVARRYDRFTEAKWDKAPIAAENSTRITATEVGQ